MGIGVEYGHHEVAPSQHEIDLRYTDALTMADKVMTYRLMVKEVAHEIGVYATFMPKPLAGENGSGMHTHQSLFEGDRNAFFDGTDEYHLSKTAKTYIAGMLRHAPEITLVTNQWVNSYKRLVPGFEAPVYVCWARRNRSALIRVPKYKPGKEERDPHRVPLAGSRLQPVPRVRGHARRGPRGDRGRVRARAGGLEQHLRDDRARARGRGHPLAARGPRRSDPAREGSEVLRDALGDHVLSSCCGTNGRSGTGTSRT